MIALQGKGVSGGVASGPVHFLRRGENRIVPRRIEDVQAEKQRFYRAQQAVSAQLAHLAERCRTETGEEAAALFEAHAMLAEDDDYARFILDMLDDAHCCAEYAVQQAGEAFAAMFAAMEDDYMRARAADIRDVSRRIIGHLLGAAEESIRLDAPVILAAEDLAPSETVRLDRQKILGLITRQGSANSHTAILARAMGIPAICGLDDLTDRCSGRPACMDGDTGRLILDPDESAIAAFRKKLRKQQELRELWEAQRGKEDITPDGRRLEICCNIGAPEDVSAVLANDGRSIGLFRSEFLYLAAADYPDEEAQFQAYRQVVSAMQGGRVVIRTLDIGADKQADYFRMPREENPALGLRAIRLCLNRPEMFRTQLRALYRASAYGRLAIMFPMIASLWELRECRRICRTVMDELDSAGIPYDRDMETGIMIETPASVLIAAELAQEADFFSVGTNDLTQYILACDRQANHLDQFFDVRHPAVFRALKMVADAAHGAGIRVSICGELAADPDLLPTFLAIGIDAISVSPASVLPLRTELRRTAAGACVSDYSEK